MSAHRFALVVVAVAACSDPPAPIVEGPIDRFTPEARLKYPTIAALYAGEQGIYRGCGPNGGVCHNGNEYPNLATLGSILDNIDRGCNAKRDPETMDDQCERVGDVVTIAGRPHEIGWTARDVRDPASRRWLLGLRDAPAQVPLFDEMVVRHDDAEVWHLGYYALAVVDPDDASGTTLVLEPYPDEPGLAYAQLLASILRDAGRPGALAVGDPNRNGLFGAELDARLIKPGNPASSYLLRRLTDPAIGPLMPRANCCGWSKASVRALWCWVDGLAPDASNALAPIDYDRCRPSPTVELLYPEPGPACEASGMCPVEAVVDGTGADFPSIYREILVARCSGSGCHDRGPVGNVDFSTEERAFASLQAKIVPRDPAASRLIQRLDPALCTRGCRTMPLGRDPIPASELARIRLWITDGATRDRP